MKEVEINVFVLPVSANERCQLALYNDKEIKLDFLTADTLDIEDHIEGNFTINGFWDEEEFVVTKLHKID